MTGVRLRAGADTVGHEGATHLVGRQRAAPVPLLGIGVYVLGFTAEL